VGANKESSAAMLTLSPASLSPVLASRLVLGEGVATGRSIPQQIVTMQSYKPTKVQLVHEKLLSVLVSTTMFIIHYEILHKNRSLLPVTAVRASFIILLNPTETGSHNLRLTMQK
jgi:hypothetical protein